MTLTLDGLVTKAQSGFFTVATPRGEFVCRIPKRLKYHLRHEQQTQERPISNIVTVGDRVTLIVTDEQAATGSIQAVAPRERVLSRTRPTAHDVRNLSQDREQVLLANPDQVVLVFAVAEPTPSLRKLDRFLVIAEMNTLPAIVCVNKVDLVEAETARQMFAVYADIGYRVIYTSAKRGDGLEELREALRGKISVLSGSSGVGKSSLLNAIEPGLGLRVNAVSAATAKGLHTTRHTELIPLAVGGYVADTPGIRTLALFNVDPQELDGYYREIAPLVAECQYSDCSHTHEANCAVRAAVAAGKISAERFNSYLRLREEHDWLDESAY